MTSRHAVLTGRFRMGSGGPDLSRSAARPKQISHVDPRSTTIKIVKTQNFLCNVNTRRLGR